MKKARILVVEDEVIIAMEIEESLKNLGYEVAAVAMSSNEALATTAKEKPDLILMDIRIQGEQDGIETAELIKERFGIPVIFSTAYLDEERIGRAKITMPFGYVLKPIQERDLKVTLEMALYVAKVDDERKKAEEFLKKVGEMAQVGGWEIFPEDRSIYWSDVVKQIHEVPLTHQPDYDEAIDFFPEESRKILDDAVSQAIENGKNYELELDFITAKGNKRYVKTIGHSVIENGKCVRLYGTFQDITARKQSESKLIQSEQLLSEIINSMEKAIAIYEPINNGDDFRFVDTNEFAEKIMHFKTEDVRGKTIKELFPGEPSVGLIEMLKETYETGKSTTIPLKQYKDDRITQWVENYIFKLPSGKVVAMFEDTYEKRKQS